MSESATVQADKIKVAVCEYLLRVNREHQGPLIPPTAIDWLGDGIVAAVLSADRPDDSWRNVMLGDGQRARLVPRGTWLERREPASGKLFCNHPAAGHSCPIESDRHDQIALYQVVVDRTTWGWKE